MIKILDFLVRKLTELKAFLIKIRLKQRLDKTDISIKPETQQLEVYWKDHFKKELKFWGEGNVWIEIEYLLSSVEGKVLDMCCGTGSTIKRLSKNSKIDLYGFDISDLFIKEAILSGINSENLRVADATNTRMENKEFDYSYSIGSLEHFTEEGISQFISEANRITKKASFHQIPVLKDKNFKGWLDLDQSYFNMEEEWWLEKFRKSFSDVSILESFWEDPISYGRWFICK